jgi:hypothetical protein
MIFIIKSNILDRSLQSCNSLPAKVATQRSNSTQQQLNVATQRSNSAQQQRQQQQLLTLKVQNTRFLSSPNNPSCHIVSWISPHLGSIFESGVYPFQKISLSGTTAISLFLWIAKCFIALWTQARTPVFSKEGGE